MIELQLDCKEMHLQKAFWQYCSRATSTAMPPESSFWCSPILESTFTTFTFETSYIFCSIVYQQLIDHFDLLQALAGITNTTAFTVSSSSSPSLSSLSTSLLPASPSCSAIWGSSAGDEISFSWCRFKIESAITWALLRYEKTSHSKLKFTVIS